ncbi:uncharacterized protein LOC143590741 [Bidens hawaiensis]|uniref:uncharacterized protein LOC143590741 n=1 Tax=Bidens hawaiensis TaxID=980011 RepID=UPI004049C986
MKGEGGCCIAKYGGGGEGMYGMSKVDRIMLKFRPIAPKPVAAGSGGSTADNGDGYVKCGRSKRKYVRVKKSERDNCKRRKKVKATTLSLLPETPDRKENDVKENDVIPVFCSDLVSPVQTTNKQQPPNPVVVCMLSGPGQKHLVQTRCNNNNNNSINSINNNKPSPVSQLTPVWLRFDTPEQVRVQTNIIKSSPSPSPSSRLPRLVSYVMVEDMWVDWKALGCTDEEITTNMEKDTCPGFISDAQGTVVWTNTAYKHMSGADNIMVVLVRKDKCLVNTNNIIPAFTCKVKVTFAGHSNRQTPALTVPCDVWRMKHGGFAWRLDVNAALSLGR